MALSTAGDSAAALDRLCKRCNEDFATTRIRSEPACDKCFCQYVTTKVIKRMETYRVRGLAVQTAKKLLLPLSFGASSACLLHILDQHLQSQYNRMGRVTYELYVVHVDVYLDAADRQSTRERLEKYRARYARHTYTTIGLEEVLQIDEINWAVFDLSHHPHAGEGLSNTEKLQALMSVPRSATSRTDVVSTFLTRLLVEVAKSHGCETVLFADTTTRLAEKTLTETAKGRGCSLPWQVSDGTSPYGIVFNYPLRDVLRKEVVVCSALVKPPLSDLIVVSESAINVSASSKTTTIDNLLEQYFESVEDNYPSIVANVVRTSSKLQPSAASPTKCDLCGFPIAPGAGAGSAWSGDQTPQTSSEHRIGPIGNLCYGCSRSLND